MTAAAAGNSSVRSSTWTRAASSRSLPTGGLMLVATRSPRWIDHDSTTGFCGDGLESRSGFRKPMDAGNWDSQAPVYEVNGESVQRLPIRAYVEVHDADTALGCRAIARDGREFSAIC